VAGTTTPIPTLTVLLYCLLDLLKAFWVSMKAFLASIVLYQTVLSYSITAHSPIKKTKRLEVSDR